MPAFVFKAKGERRVFVGDQSESCKDITALSLKSPFEKGYILDWDCLQDLLERAFSELLKANKGLTTKGSYCICTQPPITFSSVNRRICDLLFNSYGVGFVCIAPSPLLTHLRHISLHPRSVGASSKCGIVVDAGFSFTHIVPIVDGKVVTPAVIRCTIGGKFLTNYLKELVSYRAWNMMDDYYLINDVKVSMFTLGRVSLKED